MDYLSKDRLVVRLDETESTNTYLRQLVNDQHPEEGSIVIAEYQTRGRGQISTSWYSSKGDNLLFSLLIYPSDIVANEQFIISQITSLAIKNTLDQFTDDIRIKWPNDIYWQEKKIAGILIENDLRGNHIEHSIIGIGININQQIFPPELPNPISLRQIIGSESDKDNILEIFLREFFLLYREMQRGEFLGIADEYMLDLYRVNGYFPFEDANGKFQAKVETVLPSGHLVLKTLDNEERRYAFKEVTFLND